MAVLAGVMEIVACLRRGEPRQIPRQLALWTGVPLAIAGDRLVARDAGAAVLGADPRHARAGHAARSAPLPDRLSAARRSERARAADRFRRRAFRADGARAVVLRRRRLAHAAVLGGLVRSRRRQRQRAKPARRLHEPRADRRALLLLRPHALRQGAARDRAQPRRRAAGGHRPESRRRADVHARGAAVRVLAAC